MAYHPWRELRQNTGITVEWVRLHHKRAMTNGIDTIYMDKRALQVERRCSLTHEMIHIERRHTSCQPPAIEKDVRAEAARRLILIADLAAQLAWARSLDELADELWVTPEVLADRIANLNGRERELLSHVEVQSHFHTHTKGA